MFTIQRIYGFQAAESVQAVLVDRLYPRGLSKAKMTNILWLKEVAPSTELRRWYHVDPVGRFSEFSIRYLEELSGEQQRLGLARLRQFEEKSKVVLLTAVKDPQYSHVPVLIEALSGKN